MKSFPGRKTPASLIKRAEEVVCDAVARHHPQFLVVEDVFYAQARMSPAVRALAEAAKRWGRGKGLRVTSYRPTAVKERLCAGKNTRMALGEAVVRRFPFLLWKPMKTWHYRQQMLEAIALGIVAARDMLAPQGKHRAPERRAHR